MRSVTAVPLLLLALSVAPARVAGGEPVAAAAPPCLTPCADEPTNAGALACLARERSVADRDLAAAIAAVRAGHPESDSKYGALHREILKAFDAAQQAWEIYFGKDCQAVAVTWTGGSGLRAALATCQLERVRRRTRDLWGEYHLERSIAEPSLVCESW